ncbi:MAG: PAS domain S-box protein, partial [Gammaproteobacteria bacterium]|nr:PAS domain S-box protein [Gammaproteobacteria bacterium]
SESNLPQVSEISRITVLLANNHSELTSLLLSTLEDPDEERVYVKGRKILNELHLIETQLKLKISSAKKLVIDDVDIFKQIELKFTYYREAIIGAIEQSTLDAERARNELVVADNVFRELNSLFLILSDYHVRDLTAKAELIEGSLDDYELVAVLAIVLIIIMISSALYFSNHMSANLDRINQALIKLSREDVDIDLPEKNDKYLDQLTKAVHKFKSTLEKNRDQRESLKQAVEQLKDSKERYFSLLDNTATVILVIDNEQTIVLFNKEAERIFGYDSHEVLGKPMEKLIPERYRHKHNIHVNNFVASDIKYLSAAGREPVGALTKTGEEIQIETSVAKVEVAEETLMTVTITDVTQRLKAEEQILQQAHFDALTNLPNRFLSLDRLSQLLIDTQRSKERVAVLFLDLDDF